MSKDSLGLLLLEMFFRLAHAVQSLAGLADMRQRPCRGGYRPWQKDRNIQRPRHIDPMLKEEMRFGKVALQKAKLACRQMRISSLRIGSICRGRWMFRS